MFIKNNLSWIDIGVACDCLDLTRSNYYEWVATAEDRAIVLKDKQELLKQIKAVHTDSKQRYGSAKITRTLKKHDVKCSQKQVAKLMQANGIRSVVSKKYKATTNSKHNLAVFDNVLQRQFIVPTPNYAWVSDITYVPTDEGWLYVATVLDLYSSKIIGYAMNDRMTKQLVIDALYKALESRNYPVGIISYILTAAASTHLTRIKKC